MVDPEGLREWARERLAGFKLPREFVSVAALPRTESGKVQKHRLTESIAGARPDAPRRSSKP
jgi:acyl-CoA synthetase (AMP-forming)/AMP-acid ligase II